MFILYKNTIVHMWFSFVSIFLWGP